MRDELRAHVPALLVGAGGLSNPKAIAPENSACGLIATGDSVPPGYRGTGAPITTTYRTKRHRALHRQFRGCYGVPERSSSIAVP
jgi:hypothetical protein